jgi:hypothetical protein
MEKHLNHARRAIVILVVLCLGIAWQAWHTTQRADAVLDAYESTFSTPIASQ